jgi:hypothetical protein
VLGPVWESSPYVKTENITDDGGLTYSDESDELIFGAYFFLSETYKSHKLMRYNGFSYLA